MFFCGRASVQHIDEDEGYINKDPSMKTKKCPSLRRVGKDYNTNKNPYATRGLDKFNALLVELDDMRQKIYAQMGFEEVSFVQFEYSNDSKGIKPIVVRAKGMNHDVNDPNMVKNLINIRANGNERVVSSSGNGSKETNQEKKEEPKQEKKKNTCVLRYKGSFKLENMRQPCCLFPIMGILILLLLAIFGRSFAILCCSIAWYLIPTMNGERLNLSSNKRSKPKRLEKNLSGIKVAKNIDHQVAPTSPTSVINGLTTSSYKQWSGGKNG